MERNPDFPQTEEPIFDQVDLNGKSTVQKADYYEMQEWAEEVDLHPSRATGAS